MTKLDINNPEVIKALENKLSAARIRLILDKPFIGALALRLPLKVADPAWCPTTGTDARAFYYNPAYIEALRIDEVQFVMAHEALHCALSHFARRQHRVKHRWDLACDFAINPTLAYACPHLYLEIRYPIRCSNVLVSLVYFLLHLILVLQVSIYFHAKQAM